MRIGQNPAKSVKSVAQPAEVTVSVISYIPTLGGYYAESLEVLKVCLRSIWENTLIPFDLMVFDNGSCHDVQEYLTESYQSGHIQYLVLSEKNIGKAGAWNFIFGAAPGKYIAYADSDVYHYPGWLTPQLEVIERLPGVGMVTGMPMWTPEEYSTATINWAKKEDGITLTRSKSLSWDDYWKHAQSLGADEAKAKAHFDSIDNLVITHQGRQLYIGAAHFQFVTTKSVVSRFLPIPSKRPMGQVRLLDIALNEEGFLRFCTPEWWVRHMGNTVGVEHQKMTLNARKKASGEFWQKKIPRRVVSWIYHRAFEILYRYTSAK